MVYKDKEYHKKYYEKNKEEILKKHKIYKKENKDKIKKDNQIYRKENKDKIKDKDKKYKKRNINKGRKIQKKYDQKPENKTKKRKYYQKPEIKERMQKYHTIYDKKYTQEHQEQCKINNHKRRAKVKGNGGSYTLKEITKLRKDSKGICKGWKRKPHFVGDKNLTIDHIISIENGGTSYIENIQLLCKSCNCSKGKKIQK